MNNKLKSIMPAVIMCTMILSSCGAKNELQTQTNIGAKTAVNTKLTKSSNTTTSTVTKEMVTYDEDDIYSEWSNQNPNYIELNGTGAVVKGSGAKADGGKITIKAQGVYVVSGKLDNGQIIVDTKDKGAVRLVLSGSEINCADNAAIYVKNAEKTIISLQEGTQNTLNDGKKYTLENSETDEPNAAIFSKDNLTINGTGTLTVHGNYNNGITTKDKLKITGGNIYIYSADDGLIGKDSVIVKEGNITIEAGGDGIKSTNDTDSSKGFVALEGGAFKITSVNDAIQAQTNVMIYGGDFTISSGGGCENGVKRAGNDRGGPFGGRMDNADTANTDTGETESQSAKAIKSSADIAIGGGTFKIDSADDAIHSNNSVNIENADISAASGDDGIHGDSSITIKSGNIKLTKSYEGIESAVINILGGDINVVSSDDGINVAGGNDGSSVQGRPGQNDFNYSDSSDLKLNISGGYMSIDAGGDGLDSNGSIYMTGGTVAVSGPTNDGNGALDYNGVFEMSGGFLVAAGSSGMAQAPSDQSTQYSVIMNYSNVQKAGTIVHLQDSKGNAIETFAPKKEYQSVVICSPELKKDTSYTLYSGGTSTGDQTNGLYKNGKYQGGTKIVDFTISKSVTWLSESGETSAGGFNNHGGGPGGHGGGPGGSGRGMRRN